MLVRLENLYTTVLQASTDERRALDSFFERLHEELPDGETRRLWDGVAFPSGLLPLVEGEVAELEIEDERCIPLGNGVPFPTAGADLLRDYQLGAVDAVDRYGRGILHMATGAGKTVVASALHLALPCRWLFLVHKKVLLDQTVASFTNLGVPFWSEHRDSGVLVATYQSVAALKRNDPVKAAKFLALVDGVIEDECHGAAAPTPYDVVMSMPNAYYRIGLSATPLLRTDKADIFTVAALGPVIFEARAKELQERGVLARGKVRFHVHNNTAPIPRLASWDARYKAGISEAKDRNDTVVEVASSVPRPVLLFVREKDHGRTLAAAIQQNGLRSAFVSGEDKDDARRQILGDFGANKLDVLVSTVVLQDGYDLPKIRAVVNGSAGAAAIGAVQRYGRGTRKEEGKVEFELHDIYDAGDVTLRRQSDLRVSAYEAEGFEIVGLEGVPPLAGAKPPEMDDRYWTYRDLATPEGAAFLAKRGMRLKRSYRWPLVALVAACCALAWSDTVVILGCIATAIVLICTRGRFRGWLRFSKNAAQGYFEYVPPPRTLTQFDALADQIAMTESFAIVSTIARSTI